MPPDPELEAATADPATTTVELVGPVPVELRLATPMPPHPSPAVRSLRAFLITVLLAESVVGLVFGLAVVVIPDGSVTYLPRVIALVIVAAVIILAAVVWRRRSRR